MSITLTDQQWSGVKKAAAWFVQAEQTWEPLPFVFAGYAGSGKSTCVGAVIEHIGLSAEQVMYMAPTGKAAKVLTTKLAESGWPNKATTIHKAIYMPKRAKADALDRQIDQLNEHILYLRSNGDSGTRHWHHEVAAMDVKQSERKVAEVTLELGEAMDREGPTFTLKSNMDIPEEVRIFVVDEASMVGSEVAQDLIKFGLPILAIGDPGQLSPVGDTWGFAMEDPDVFLTEIHRQAAENPIIRLATMARQGKELKVGDYGDGVRVLNRRDDDVTYNMERDAMVLIGTHKKRWSVTKRIRKELGIDCSGPVKDEPLLVCKNSTQKAGLVNGTFLICNEDHGDLLDKRARFQLQVIDPDAGDLEHNLWVTQGLFEEHRFRRKNAHSAADRDAFKANKECEHVDWGHAITVHKSQGSEFDDVALHDESPVFRADAKRWLYTGITRSSKLLTVIV